MAEKNIDTCDDAALSGLFFGQFERLMETFKNTITEKQDILDVIHRLDVIQESFKNWFMAKSVEDFDAGWKKDNK